MSSLTALNVGLIYIFNFQVISSNISDFIKSKTNNVLRNPDDVTQKVKERISTFEMTHVYERDNSSSVCDDDSCRGCGRVF